MHAPAARLVGYAETGTPQWFAMREGKITGSRIAACVGLSPWVSPFTLYYQLIGLTTEEVDVESSPWIDWGNRLEPAVIQRWAEKHPNTRVRTRKTVWQNRERPWQQVSPDALVVSPGAGSPRRPADAILEVKTSQYRDSWGTPGTDEIPVYYRCQIIWMLDTLGLDVCHVAALFSGWDYQEYCVRYDEADALILREAAQEMLRRVEQRDRPDLDAHSATYELIRSFHPDIDGSTVELPPDLAEAVVVAQAAARETGDTLATVRAALAEYMGTAKVARYRDHKIADRRSRGGGTPYVQLADVPTSEVLSLTIREALAS